MTANSNITKGRIVRATGIAMMICGLVVTPWALADHPATSTSGPVASTTTTQTGGGTYTTTVKRQTAGELSTEDFRQVTMLGSQILTHIGAASDYLVDENEAQAREELRHAQTLINVIRDLLPTTTVTTVVTDADGQAVYRYEQKVQDDQIPLYDDMVAVDVLQAMVDKKEEDAALRGLRLADAQLIHTSAMLDLPYVERKVNRAIKLLDKGPDDSIEQLLFAYSRGVRLKMNKEDDPLVKAQAAIRLAERMTREGKHEAADENLKLAKLHLETYRSVVGEQGQGKIKELQREIQKLAGRTDEPGASEEIQGFWDRITGWFSNEEGEAHVTTGTASGEQAVAAGDGKHDTGS